MDRVAVLGEERSTVDLVASAFECQGVETARIACRAEAATALRDKPHLLLILCLAEVDGADLRRLPRPSAASADTPIVFAVPSPSLEIALRAVHLGAFDMLILPPTGKAVRELLVRAHLHRKNMILRRLATLAPFLGRFAHEMRNPLSGILTVAQLLIERSTQSDPVQCYLKIIVEEGGRLEQSLRRVNELGRSARGPFVQTALNAVVERVLDYAGPRLKAQDIRLTRRLDPQLPEVWIDVPQVELAVSRVIDNATEAMSTGGVMTVLTRLHSGDGMIELEVADTGVVAGLEREWQLCDPFMSGLKEDELGLVFALQTFVEHGGDMLFHTYSGEGCSILARLPLNGRRGQQRGAYPYY